MGSVSGTSVGAMGKGRKGAKKGEGGREKKRNVLYLKLGTQSYNADLVGSYNGLAGLFDGLIRT